MGGHIIHRPVVARSQPCRQVTFRPRQFHPGKTDCIKAKLASPFADFFLKRIEFIRMHDDHLTEPEQSRALTLASEADTQRLGNALASQLGPGMVIWLEGDLGSGKTTLVRAILQSAGETGSVKSPTYTLVEVHPISGLNFYHFDFYRFMEPEEYFDAGLDEYFGGAGICLVEWPDKAAPYLASADLRILLSTVDEDARLARFIPHTQRGKQCLKAIFRPTDAPH